MGNAASIERSMRRLHPADTEIHRVIVRERQQIDASIGELVNDRRIGFGYRLRRGIAAVRHHLLEIQESDVARLENSEQTLGLRGVRRLQLAIPDGVATGSE